MKKQNRFIIQVFPEFPEEILKNPSLGDNIKEAEVVELEDGVMEYHIVIRKSVFDTADGLDTISNRIDDDDHTETELFLKDIICSESVNFISYTNGEYELEATLTAETQEYATFIRYKNESAAFNWPMSGKEIFLEIAKAEVFFANAEKQ